MPNFKITVENLADPTNTLCPVGQTYNETGVAASQAEVEAEIDQHMITMHGPDWRGQYNYTVEQV